MVRGSFHQQLNDLRDDVLRMGNMVECFLDLAMTALKRQDKDLAAKVVMDDDKVDQLELQIEKQCLSLLALHQPVARDLRFIGATLKFCTDLERIGDYASSIAKITLSMGNEPFIKPLVALPRMAEIAQEMLRENLVAYVEYDRELALKSAAKDHEIDHLYKETFTELLTLMTEDPKNVMQSTYLMLAAKYLERIGDHATNLSEWVIYMVTGERLDLND
ncbi:phosphate signaling complex protein PhoU [Desulforudis sp. DRI-14]|jgi:phosphate transport system protein|uniref:phosphate signaling complex protein PhoU n=1 Tax=Desulforudis sp. DRI-14 TaxID=3459793 RepID=UPI0040424D3E